MLTSSDFDGHRQPCDCRATRTGVMNTHSTPRCGLTCDSWLVGCADWSITQKEVCTLHGQCLQYWNKALSRLQKAKISWLYRFCYWIFTLLTTYLARYDMLEFAGCAQACQHRAGSHREQPPLTTPHLAAVTHPLPSFSFADTVFEVGAGTVLTRDARRIFALLICHFLIPHTADQQVKFQAISTNIQCAWLNCTQIWVCS